ncbi:transcriptional regulator [Pacificimonas flava]|uniref:Transcriptional regulator n=2 Tax=Pacificimonas TaxID=1960290 RepID=A0A219B8J5_9SPHN|nr:MULTISPECIES: helix-turn-helix transcriptional regulator [Pacificimonas]MBZ6377872.1 helix-turn-helix transcriptional regulator [Pacificimonas aurantium]OWV34601.1 transcriptional regulator [Pacificimonas flava]
MKKIIPRGDLIKHLRLELERLSTQKEMANEIAVSVRMLRKIENENALIAPVLLDRIAKLLGVHRKAITLTLPTPLAAMARTDDGPRTDFDKEKLIPRHDWEYAQVTSDDGALYKEASNAHDLACVIEVPLNPETGTYVQDIVDMLTALTWSQRDIRHDIPASDQIATRRRLRELIVLLRGNDIWIYQARVLRRLPERYDLPPAGEPSTMEFRLTVAFGPPCEYGETSMKVPVDHGQPFVLPAWSAFVEKQGAPC